MRRALIPALLLLGLGVTGCGAGDEAEVRGAAPQTVRGHGLRMELPPGWHGGIVRPEPPGALTLRAANFPHRPLTDLGGELQLTMGARDVLITLVHYGRVKEGWQTPEVGFPLSIDRAHFVAFEGFKRPVATDAFALDGGAFELWVVFRDGTPSDEVLAEANRVLATIAVEPRRLELNGLSIELPVGWDGFARQHGHDDEAPALFAANVAWPERSDVQALLERLPPDGVVVSVVSSWSVSADVARTTLRQPITLDDGRFSAGSYEGQPAPNVSTQRMSGRVGDRYLWIQVFFGRNDPDRSMRDEAEAVLATLEMSGRPPAPAPPGWRKHHAPDVGVHATVPGGWHVAGEPLTSIEDPREVLALATYPLTGGDGDSPCAAVRAVETMPADGALIWVLEHRADLPQSRFPPRPKIHELSRDDVEPGVCGAALGHHTTFRDADRLFQVWLLFGERVSDVRLAETAQLLSGLSFDGLPAPPPDPYGGWPWLSTGAGDSLRTPPGWAARSETPRALFVAANRRLALPNVPRDGVVLWVVEEDTRRPIDGDFPPIDHEWPREHHFRPTKAPTSAAQEVTWLRAGGEWSGHRFSVWIASGTDAAEEDRQLALKSAASLAVSGCRGDGGDCGDR
jgi:hypothetical protein